jgi:exodeoxyribonuclease V alpha subunit
VETAHALTIHKSQGSEYEHAIVILPEKPSRIVSRELLYTGVTRASERVTLVGSRAVIEAAIGRPIRRATGLAERLRGG